MDIYAIWNGASAAVGAVVVAVGSTATWITKNKSTWYPIVEALGVDSHGKQAKNDALAVIAAKDSTARNALIGDLVKEGLLALQDQQSTPNSPLTDAETWLLQKYVVGKLPADMQPYATTEAIQGVLNGLPAAIADAQKGEWFQAVQALRQNAPVQPAQPQA